MHTPSPCRCHSGGLPDDTRLTVLAYIEQQLRRGRQRLCTRGQQRLMYFIPWGKRRSVAWQGCGHRLETRRSSDWKRLSAGGRNQRTAAVMIGAISNWPILEVEEFSSANQGLWTRGLLIRRHITDGDLAFFATTWCPAATSIETLGGGRSAIGGQSRTVLRPAKTSSDPRSQREQILHGRHRHVSPGDARSPRWRQSADRANPPPAKKRTAEPWQTQKHRHAVTDPLVNPGSPPHRHQTSLKSESQPAHVIAQSLWRRAHQAVAQRAHFKAKRQL